MNPIFSILMLLLAGNVKALAGTSTEHRQEKTITAATEVGSAVYPLPSAGFSLGFFATPDIRLEANYTKGEIDFIDELSSKLYAARVKFFFGNSFYVNVGAAYRELDLTIDEWLFSDRRLSRSMHHVGGELSLGNNWQFSSFSIGCDWAGYFLPLRKLKDTRQQSGARRSLFGAQSNPENDNGEFASEDRWERYANGGTWQAVRMNVGWSF